MLLRDVHFEACTHSVRFSGTRLAVGDYCRIEPVKAATYKLIYTAYSRL